jgi:hypothetical protein
MSYQPDIRGIFDLYIRGMSGNNFGRKTQKIALIPLVSIIAA